jgi:ABC-type bacteriocin/lantibiotic exporter with double-glycine peptidase domain
MKLFHRHHNEEGPPPKFLQAEHLSIAFDRPVLKDVSIELSHGETVAVLGKSGTGKSVLLKLIVGLLFPDEGQILYKGNSVNRMNE